MCVCVCVLVSWFLLFAGKMVDIIQLFVSGLPVKWLAGIFSRQTPPLVAQYSATS